MLLHSGLAKRGMEARPHHRILPHHSLSPRSIYATGLVIIPATLYVLWVEMNHHHHDHAPTYAHMHVARKRWPWAENCAMFDIQCKSDWSASHGKGGKAAAAHH